MGRSRRTLGKTASLRKAVLRNLTASLVLYEKVKTTKAKSKEVVASFERMVNFAKKGRLSDKRAIYSFFWDKNPAKKIIEELSGRYKNKKSGYAKTVALGTRRGDNAELVSMELTEKPKIKEEKSQEKGKKENKGNNESKDDKENDKKESKKSENK